MHSGHIHQEITIISVIIFITVFSVSNFIEVVLTFPLLHVLFLSSEIITKLDIGKNLNEHSSSGKVSVLSSMQQAIQHRSHIR